MHTKIDMHIMWKQLYNGDTSSRTVKGSLYQLQVAIQRTNVPVKPDKNMNSAEAFIEDVLASYVLAAACAVLKEDNAEQFILQSQLPVNFSSLPALASEIVAKFTDITTYTQPNPSYPDEVHQYTIDTIMLALIWAAYHDASREGDGSRVIDIWRHLLCLFHINKHSNYAQEAALLLTQLEYLASPRLKQQIMQGRFVNTQGIAGRNIPCDLHMEHLNRWVVSCMCMGTI